MNRVYGRDEQKKAIREHAAFLREAASEIPKIREAARKFDGKVYNCRLDEAIKTVSDEASHLRVYATKSYGGWYTIVARRYNNDISLLDVYGAKPEDWMSSKGRDELKVFGDDKRLNFQKFNAALSAKYAEIMKKASELETAADMLDEYLDKIDILKKTISTVIESVPYEVRDICGVTR